jgi:hypothetical protein
MNFAEAEVQKRRKERSGLTMEAPRPGQSLPFHWPESRKEKEKP